MGTQINDKQILKNSITGASIHNDYGIYDETKNYNTDDECWIDGFIYKAKVNITGGERGDMSNSPKVSSDWKLVSGVVYSVYPSTVQNFDDNRITVTYDTIRYDSDVFSLNTSNGEITVNEDGGYILNLTQTNTDHSTNDRSTSYTFIQVDIQDGNGFVDIPNFRISGYHRNSTDGETTGSSSMPMLFNAGDKIRVQCKENDTSGNCDTVPDACNLTIWAPSGSRGPKGDKGDTGSSSIIIQDDGSDLPNTPHSTLNFANNLEAVDVGYGIVNIYGTPTKQKYVQIVWAEENAGLNSDTYEWAFGNGANSPSGHGVPIYVPSGYSAQVVALGINCASNNGDIVAEIKCEVSPPGGSITAVGSVIIDMPTNGENREIKELSTPVSIINASVLNFKTVSVSGSTIEPNVATAYIEFTEN